MGGIKERFCFISKPNTQFGSKMLLSLLEQPPENEAKAVFICNTNLMNSSGLMILLDLIKAVVRQAEALLLGKGLVFWKLC